MTNMVKSITRDYNVLLLLYCLLYTLLLCLQQMQSIVILLKVIYNSIILGLRHISIILVRQFQFSLPSFPPQPFLLLSVIFPMSFLSPLFASAIHFHHIFTFISFPHLLPFLLLTTNLTSHLLPLSLSCVHTPFP